MQLSSFFRTTLYVTIDCTMWPSQTKMYGTCRLHTMGNKEPKPWSPRLVRQKLREKSNDLPLNDLNYDEKPSADVE
jgi:hypothetical protein